MKISKGSSSGQKYCYWVETLFSTFMLKDLILLLELAQESANVHDKQFQSFFLSECPSQHTISNKPKFMKKITIKNGKIKTFHI